MDFSDKKVAVLDTIHGGKTICHKLRKMNADAMAVDIYRGSPSPEFIDQFDIVIAPVHAATLLVERARLREIPIITHHKVVGDIMRESATLVGTLVFEITGVRGKTTVSRLLAELNSDKRLLLLSSSGLQILERGECVATERLSITPASMLTAIDVVNKLQIKPTVLIFEVSLGGTGIADIGVITSLSPEYRIASNSRSSTEAKLQMISHAKKGSLIVARSNEVDAAALSIHCNSFGMQGSNVSYDINGSRDGVVRVVYDCLTTVDGTVISGEMEFTPTHYYDWGSYSDAILCFIAAALSANYDPERIASTLTEFKGIEGRMSFSRVDNRLLVDNSNSGLTPSLARRAIAIGLARKKRGERAVLIIGEEAHNVCEGINQEEIAFISLDDNLDEVILVGERMRSKRSQIMRSANLEAALTHALALTNEGDVIISCVKKWR